MDILWRVLTLPYAPVLGLTAVVKVIAREAESRLQNPANIRRELEELDAAEAAGEITAEQRDWAQRQVLNRLTGGSGRRPSAPARRPSRAAGGRARSGGGVPGERVARRRRGR